MLLEDSFIPFNLTSTDRLSEGLQYLSAGGIDVILLDLIIPDSYGLDTLAKVHAQSSTVPIVIISNLGNEDVIFKAVEKGAQDYLIKEQINSNLLWHTIHYAIKRKQEEKLLYEKEEKYRNFIETIKEQIWEVDANGVYTYISPTTREIYGLEPDEVIGKTPFDLMPPKEAQQVGGEFKKIVESQKSFSNLENIALHKDGGQIIMETSGVPFFSTDGTLLGYRGTARDITKRKKSEAKLIESEEKFRTISTAAQDGIIMMDNNGIVNYWNKAAESMMGYTSDEIIGMNLHKVLAPKNYYEAFEKGFSTFKGTGKGAAVGKTLELSALTNKGIEFPIELSLSSVLLDNKWNAIGIIRDITERKQIQEELKKRQKMEVAYSKFITNINRSIDLNTILSEGINNLIKYTNGTDGTVYLFDPEHEVLIPHYINGMKKAVVERKYRLGEGIPGETGLKKEMIIKKEKNTDSSTTIISTPLIFKDILLGVIIIHYTTEIEQDMLDFIQRVIDQHAVSVYNANAYIEMQEMAAKLRNQRDELEIRSQELAAANKTKSEFLANMSHELRTPLNSIIGFSEILHDMTFGELNEKQLKYMANILSSGKHLLHLINDILDLSKVEAGKMEMIYEDVDVSLAFIEIKTLVSSIASKKNIALDITVDTELSTIRVDTGKFRQILFNLTSNAIKFTPKGGSVTIDAKHIGDNVQIAVTDTGIGISKEDQNKLFQSFVQIDSSASREYAGTGLGLTLVKKFVELHNGKVWVISELEKGSSFIFTIPVDPI